LSFERIVAVGLLTKNDVRLLGPTFDRSWPVQDAPCFNDLLRAIDDADRRLECSSHLTQRRQAPDPID
jgi:hypothetical protein